MFALIAIAWYLVGVAGFLYWYSSEFDVTCRHLFLAALVGLIGPASWLVGYFIHGKSLEKVIIRKRGAK